MTILTLPNDLELKPLDYTRGYLVKTTADGVRVEIWQMLFNWRIVTTPESFPGLPLRAWCYQGLTQQSFITAALTAHAWSGDDDTEPAGYFKRAGDQAHYDRIRRERKNGD